MRIERSMTDVFIQDAKMPEIGIPYQFIQIKHRSSFVFRVVTRHLWNCQGQTAGLWSSSFYIYLFTASRIQ